MSTILKGIEVRAVAEAARPPAAATLLNITSDWQRAIARLTISLVNWLNGPTPTLVY